MDPKPQINKQTKNLIQKYTTPSPQNPLAQILPKPTHFLLIKQTGSNPLVNLHPSPSFFPAKTRQPYPYHPCSPNICVPSTHPQHLLSHPIPPQPKSTLRHHYYFYPSPSQLLMVPKLQLMAEMRQRQNGQLGFIQRKQKGTRGTVEKP